MAVLCLGEALVDLICERPASSFSQADAFVPHPGGATANVAVSAAQRGAQVELAGGAGRDEWGRWLKERLRREGVGTTWFELRERTTTPVAFVVVSAEGEPDYLIYGDSISTAVSALGSQAAARAAASCDALFFGSNTLVAADARAVTLAAREAALEAGRPVVVDPNLRLHRWPSTAEAVAVTSACVPGALLVKGNRDEAELLTGEPDPVRAADALVAAGACMACVTLGAAGAVLRGEARARADGLPARVISTVGAGDAFAGVLLAALAGDGFAPAAAARALPEAVAVAARVTERWGALA